MSINFVIYHNPRCKKSRETLERIKKKGNYPKVVEYLKNPPSQKHLEKLLDQLAIEPEKLVRKKEARYKELGLATHPPKNKKSWIKVLSENPVLIERPIVTNGKRAVLGRPPENVDELF